MVKNTRWEGGFGPKARPRKKSRQEAASDSQLALASFCARFGPGDRQISLTLQARAPENEDPDQATSSISGVWASPGGPGQPDPDQATSLSLGVWAALGGPEASRTPTKRHLRFWGSGRPRAAQKPAGPRPNDIFDLGGLGGHGRPWPPGPRRSEILDCGCLGGPGRPRSQPDTDQTPSRILGSGRLRAAQASWTPTKGHLRFRVSAGAGNGYGYGGCHGPAGANSGRESEGQDLGPLCGSPCGPRCHGPHSRDRGTWS